ncbi:hypothetical protein KSS87_006967 [Heliosperma pusillum]|nr:hypothetical protein KSS87_006967 [Heliosperma pusillum]
MSSIRPSNHLRYTMSSFLGMSSVSGFCYEGSGLQWLCRLVMIGWVVVVRLLVGTAWLHGPVVVVCVVVVRCKCVVSWFLNIGRSTRFTIGVIELAEWGKMSMCDAEKRLLANALLDISNEWFVLLSESCVPLYNFSIIHNYISRSKYSFMGVFDDPGPFGRGRYNENMAPEVNITQWRKGSQWFELNRRLAINIVEDNIFYQKFEAFCKPHCYVDEHYFPTMLHIRAGEFLANRSITFVDWSRGGAHPATFGRGDITEDFFKRIVGNKACKYNDQNSSTCYLFARKFAPSALQPLLQLSPAVLGF